MNTLVVYPDRIKRAEAYVEVSPGEIWGPLWPFHWRKKDSGYRDAGLNNLKAGETFESYLRRIAQGWKLAPTKLNAGHYYPRIWRTGVDVEEFGEAIPRVEDTPFLASFVNSLEQLEGLFDDLLSIFRVVHPEGNNLHAFGSEIRELLILACTEVETQWKAVLQANLAAPISGFFKTSDYVKLKLAMRLDEFEVGLIRYPDIPAVKPFAAWDQARATKSLLWYDAYNQVKHDREANFEQASLRHAIESVAACFVMLAAQFGCEALHRHQLKPLFDFRHRPMWEPEEWYYQSVPGQSWVQVPYSL